MGQYISLKSERKNPWFNISAHTINCVCHSIRSMFRVLGIYNFGFQCNSYIDFELNLIIILPLFSDLCVFKNVFGNSVYHSGILELPTIEYSWSHWLPYCKFAETNRNFGNTASFLYHVHNAIYIVVSWQSFAKI